MHFFGNYFETPSRYMGIVYVILVLLIILLVYYTLALSETLVSIYLFYY